ncbi:MAG: DUF3489 domain-containing protein [Rhizobiaceae bacterium]
MTTITDNQCTVLQAAAHSANLAAWPVPRKLNLNTGSATIVVKGLLKKGLVEERPALGNDPIWREVDGGKHLTLVISKAGLAALGMVPQHEPAQASTAASEPSTSTTIAATSPRMPRVGSKLAIIIALLSREEGATVVEMAVAMNWQTHSVRGVMSGMLVAKFGLRTTSKRVEGRGRVYMLIRP